MIEALSDLLDLSHKSINPSTFCTFCHHIKQGRTWLLPRITAPFRCIHLVNFPSSRLTNTPTSRVTIDCTNSGVASNAKCRSANSNLFKINKVGSGSDQQGHCFLTVAARLCEQLTLPRQHLTKKRVVERAENQQLLQAHMATFLSANLLVCFENTSRRASCGYCSSHYYRVLQCYLTVIYTYYCFSFFHIISSRLNRLNHAKPQAYKTKSGDFSDYF